MVLLEVLGSGEVCEGEKKRVLLIGSNAGDDVRQMTRNLGEFLEEKGLDIKVDFVRSAYAITDAIDGIGHSKKKVQASFVIVGQEARHYGRAGGLTINVDSSGLIDRIREECGKRGIPLARYRINPGEFYEYYLDERENGIGILPSSK